MINYKSISIYFEKKILNIIFIGMSTGIPFLLTLSTLNLWLKECGISNTIIGLFVIVTLPSTFRFLFGPMIDRIKIPILSKYFCQRLSWIILCQLLVVILLIGMSYSNPINNIWAVGMWAFGISFFSSVKDVVIQAYRIEICDKDKEGYNAAASNIGFRLGLMIGGAGAILLASFVSWQATYQIVALIIFFLLIQTIFMEKSPFTINIEKLNITKIYKNAFFELIMSRNYISILLFILFYKSTDILLSSMTIPFLYDIGYSKMEMGEVYNVVAFLSMLLGGFIGGIFINNKGLYKSILYGVIVKSFSCLLFLLHSFIGKNIFIFMLCIGFDKFMGMLTTTALISYFSTQSHHPYVSTQFSLFSSMGSVARIFLTMIAGLLADIVPWNIYFFIVALCAFPSLLFLKKSMAPRNGFEPLT